MTVKEMVSKVLAQITEGAGLTKEGEPRAEVCFDMKVCGDPSSNKGDPLVVAEDHPSSLARVSVRITL